MPWSDTTPMDQKTQFIVDYLRKRLSMSELCDLYRISRKTAYKLVERYLKHGPSGLEERSRRPSSSCNYTPEHIVEAIVALRQRHPSWGAKKLLPMSPAAHLSHEPAVRELWPVCPVFAIIMSRPTIMITPTSKWYADFFYNPLEPPHFNLSEEQDGHFLE